MNSDAKIERIKLNPNFNTINLNQGINNPSFSSASNNIQNINNVETIDFSNYSSVNSNSIDIPHSKTKSALEKTGATGVSVITSLGEGLGLFGEAIVDAGAIISTAQSSVTTGIIDGGQALFDVGKGTIKAIKNNDNVFDSIKNEFDNYQSLTVNNWENTKSFVSNEYVKTAFDGFYENNSAGKWISDTSYGFDNVRNVGSGVGYVGGIVAISVATFGVGGAAIGGSAAATTATTSGLSATMAGVAATAGLGKGSQNAWNDGASLGKGLAYGTASAVWEGAQFYAGGQINALNVGSNALANEGVRVGLDTLTGASEGFAQPALQKIYKDKSYSELFNQAGGWKNVGIQAGMAAGMSTLGEASGLAKKIRENNTSSVKSNTNSLDYDLQFFAGEKNNSIDYITINNKINELKNSGLFDQKQLDAIKYASYIPNVDEKILINPNISSEYMTMYTNLAKKGIDIKKYIDNNWHQRGFDSKQLYDIIGADSKGYDINSIKPSMNIEEIRNEINGQIDANKIGELLKKSSLTDDKKLKLLELDPSNEVTMYLLRLSEKNDISPLLKDGLKDFNLEQVKYLWSISSIGDDINMIYNPKLSVEQMKEKMINSKNSNEFFFDTMNSVNQRKNKLDYDLQFFADEKQSKDIPNWIKNGNQNVDFVNEKGLLDVKKLPLSSDEGERIVQQKLLNGEELSLNDRLKLRDRAVTKIDNIDLRSDCVYRATDSKALNDYIKRGTINDIYDNAKRESESVHWYLGGTSTRYGKVIIEAPANPSKLSLTKNYGGLMSGNPNIRHAITSQDNAISLDEVSRILFLDDKGEKVLKIIEPNNSNNLMKEVESGNLLYKQDHLLKLKNELGDKFTPEMKSQLD